MLTINLSGLKNILVQHGDPIEKEKRTQEKNSRTPRI